MEYIIEEANANDANELSILKRKVWETTYRGIYPDSKLDNYDLEANKNKFINIINNPDIILYIVRVNKEIIAYMSVGKPIREFMDYKQEIGLFYILKEYQGNGLGRKLFDIAYNNIKENGYDRFFISCNKYNLGAQEFYKKMGGVIVHTDSDYEDKSMSQVKFHYDIRR